MGAYSDSRGAPGVRAEVAAFIERRDGVPSSPDAIFLTEGASPSVKYILNALIRDSRDGILTPIPQYPLYSACIQHYGGTLVPYELDEAAGWGMDVGDLAKRAAAARAARVAAAFNACSRVTCNATEGAMYAFPRIHLSEKALAAANEAGEAPDTWYCLKLVEATGILTVPGSGFGQADGTFHLRTTILPEDARSDKMTADFRAFNDALMAEYE